MCHPVEYSDDKLAEIVHRLCHQRDAARKVHARGESGREVQTVENRRVHAVRILHHDTHRVQHDPLDDEGMNGAQNFRKGASFVILPPSRAVPRGPSALHRHLELHEPHLHHVLYLRVRPQTHRLRTWGRDGGHSFPASATELTRYISRQSYFKDSWNTFDFVTVVGSIVDALMVEFAVNYSTLLCLLQECRERI